MRDAIQGEQVGDDATSCKRQRGVRISDEFKPSSAQGCTLRLWTTLTNGNQDDNDPEYRLDEQPLLGLFVLSTR
jgi:hypothetical protein